MWDYCDVLEKEWNTAERGEGLSWVQQQSRLWYFRRRPLGRNHPSFLRNLRGRTCRRRRLTGP